MTIRRDKKIFIFELGPFVNGGRFTVHVFYQFGYAHPTSSANVVANMFLSDVIVEGFIGVGRTAMVDHVTLVCSGVRRLRVL